MTLSPLERALAAAVAVLLAIALFAVGVGVGRNTNTDNDDGGSASTPGATSDDTTTTTPAAPANTALPDPGPAPQPTLEASARAVAYDGAIGDLASIQLGGNPDLDTYGEVFDSTGASRGSGRLQTDGAMLTLTGTALHLELAGELRLAGGRGRIANPSPAFSALEVTTTQPLGVAAPTINFTPSGQQRPTKLAGPVTIAATGRVSVGSFGDLEWANPPATMHLADRGERTTLSWAGTGVVRAGGQEHRAGHLGIKATSIDATVERVGNAYRIRGEATVAQAYADGLPKLPGQGTVRIKSTPGRIPRGFVGSFVWAPENDGTTDFVMTRIRPGNAEAAWVSLGLDTLPAMCGGETCPTKGGDTSGFRKGKPINAVIVPGTGDERRIDITVPRDAALGRRQVVIVVEGNFAPIRVVVDFEVVEPPPPTTTQAQP